ncbi:hypothetical protein ACRALDRAFT_212722, partial [Sodiomyces alcalophilus JCM 7366]|uniref:uncharacterized protein n=1 Tax=Sodiomyces alcalophilus JCM 7366 TaxID=591952 RepID=UPI0039B5E60D
LSLFVESKRVEREGKREKESGQSTGSNRKEKRDDELTTRCGERIFLATEGEKKIEARRRIYWTTSAEPWAPKVSTLDGHILSPAYFVVLWERNMAVQFTAYVVCQDHCRLKKVQNSASMSRSGFGNARLVPWTE